MEADKAETSPTLRTARLSKYQADGTMTAFYLVNGVRLIGRVLAFDEQSVVIDSNQPGLDDGILIERANIATTQRSTGERERTGGGTKK